MGTKAAKGRAGVTNRVGVTAVTCEDGKLARADTGVELTEDELALIDQVNGVERKTRDPRPAWKCDLEIIDAGNTDSDGSAIARGVVIRVSGPSSPPYNAPHPEGFPTAKVGDKVFVCPFTFRAGSPPLPEEAGPGTIFTSDLQWQGDTHSDKPWQSGYVHEVLKFVPLTAESKAAAIGGKGIDSLIEGVKKDLGKLAEALKKTPQKLVEMEGLIKPLADFRDGLADGDPSLQRAKSAAGTLQAKIGELLAPTKMVSAKERALAEFDAWLTVSSMPAPAPEEEEEEVTTEAALAAASPLPAVDEDEIEEVEEVDALDLAELAYKVEGANISVLDELLGADVPDEEAIRREAKAILNILNPAPTTPAEKVAIARARIAATKVAT